MPSKVWNRYKKIKDIHINSNINTYLARIEYTIKEIIPNNRDEYSLVKEKLERIKNIIKINEIIEEDNKLYAIIDNNEETISKFDHLILSEESIIKKECVLKDQGNPVTKKEILDLLKFEESMCKISIDKIEKNEIKNGTGAGFFCEIDKIENFPFKFGLFTNYHVLDDYNLSKGIINIKFYDKSDKSYKKKEIKLDDKRKVFKNQELDYTCIEMHKSDDYIKKFFKIDPILFTKDKNAIIKSDIFILHYPKCNDLSFSFSYGKISSLDDNEILHSASTDHGSSGSPIIRRCKENYIIGLHHGGIPNENNYAIIFDSILIDINKTYKNDKNEINCIYIKKYNENEIQLLHDYSKEHFYNMDESGNEKLQYFETKELNKKIFEDNTELYINEKKVKFNYKYKDRENKENKENKEIKVKFKFKNILTDMSYMFYCCFSLVSIDLSLFNTNKVTNMSNLFCGCSSLKSINLSSFNTDNVTNMKMVFKGCTSLKSLDLTSFKKNEVVDMSEMFSSCWSLVSIDLSSFNTDKVINMSKMFADCSSLKSLDLSSFNTDKVTNMNGMFHMFNHRCSLKSINLSSFNTDEVTNMRDMFLHCNSLESLDLTSFNTKKVTNMDFMFRCCTSLKSLDLSSFNTDKVTSMICMFNYCLSLESLDLSLFNTKKNAFNSDIFESTPLKTIKINNKNDPILEFVHDYTIIK